MVYYVELPNRTVTFENEEDALAFASDTVRTEARWAVVTKEHADKWQSVIKVF